MGDDTVIGGPGSDQINGDWGDDTFPIEDGDQDGDQISDNDQAGPPILQLPSETLNTAPTLQAH